MFNCSMCVKSDDPSRPGSCTWLKNTSLAGPCSARHWRTRRSTVRRRCCQSWPGYSLSKTSRSVLAWSLGSPCNSSCKRGQTSTSGSARVRQVWAARQSLGSWPKSLYFLAVFRSMPAFIAACRSEALRLRFRRSSLTCASVTCRPCPIRQLLLRRSCQCNQAQPYAMCSDVYWGRLIVAGGEG
jgi:hypothetical protein